MQSKSSKVSDWITSEELWRWHKLNIVQPHFNYSILKHGRVSMITSYNININIHALQTCHIFDTDTGWRISERCRWSSDLAHWRPNCPPGFSQKAVVEGPLQLWKVPKLRVKFVGINWNFECRNVLALSAATDISRGAGDNTLPQLSIFCRQSITLNNINNIQ